MSINDAISSALPEFQAMAESLMTLTLTPHAPTGNYTTNPEGYEVPELLAQTPHVGKVQAGSQAGSDVATRYVRVGAVDVPVISGGLHIPLGAPIPAAGEESGTGWEYAVTAVGPADDPALLGRRYRVVGAPAKSHATARRLDVIEV